MEPGVVDVALSVMRCVDGVELDAVDVSLCDAPALDARLSLAPMKHGRRARARQTNHARIRT